MGSKNVAGLHLREESERAKRRRKKPSSEEFIFMNWRIELENENRFRYSLSAFTRSPSSARRVEVSELRIGRKEIKIARVSMIHSHSDDLYAKMSMREDRGICDTWDARSWKCAWNFAIWSSYETGQYSQIPPKKNEQNLRNVSQNRFSNIIEIFYDSNIISLHY